jgi:CubicO group peptidase (beta-lactamase class C family)
MTGIAEEKDAISISDKVSIYLEEGWTNEPLAKENLIKIEHLLTMTSGIDDGFGDSVNKENLNYKADAGQRWAYHNVYVLLQDIISRATNKTYISFFNENLKEKIGMDGNWITLRSLKVYYSTARSMAKFGLLALNKGLWKDSQLVPKEFFMNSINSSQSINESYGYLWWLNGKNSYHLPQSQIEFSGSIIPNAPKDMYAALGKNDQKIYVVPSKNLVIVRMGESAKNTNLALTNYDNELWTKINAVIN